MKISKQKIPPLFRLLKKGEKKKKKRKGFVVALNLGCLIKQTLFITFCVLIFDEKASETRASKQTSERSERTFSGSTWYEEITEHKEEK